MDYNSRVNLTAITERDAVFALHFDDSRAVANEFLGGKSVVDVGSGAGFPGLVIAIERPDLRVTLLEGRGKRCGFLRLVVGELGLENVVVENGRAEEWKGEKFDYAVARAVARLPKLMKFCVPLVKSGGEFWAWKTTEDEILEADREVKKFGLTFLGGVDYVVGGAKRVVLRFLRG